MTINIPDDVLRLAGMTEKEAVVEFACHLFDAEKIDLPTAGRLAGLPRVEMENELAKRHIPIYRPTLEDYLHDMEALRRLRN